MALVSAGFDLLLALSCVGAGVWLLRQGEPRLRYAALGMALMAVAAGFGALRYAGFEQLAGLHRGASRLAGGVTPPSVALVAAALCFGWQRLSLALGVLIAAALAIGVGLDVGLYATALGSVAVLVMLGLALRERTRAALTLACGGLILALAGLAIGSQGTLGPFARIDLFHLTLALAHLLMAGGLVGLTPEPRSTEIQS